MTLVRAGHAARLALALHEEIIPRQMIRAGKAGQARPDDQSRVRLHAAHFSAECSNTKRRSDLYARPGIIFLVISLAA